MIDDDDYDPNWTDGDDHDAGNPVAPLTPMQRLVYAFADSAWVVHHKWHKEITDDDKRRLAADLAALPDSVLIALRAHPLPSVRADSEMYYERWDKDARERTLAKTTQEYGERGVAFAKGYIEDLFANKVEGFMSLYHFNSIIEALYEIADEGAPLETKYAHWEANDKNDDKGGREVVKTSMRLACYYLIQCDDFGRARDAFKYCVGHDVSTGRMAYLDAVNTMFGNSGLFRKHDFARIFGVKPCYALSPLEWLVRGEKMREYPHEGHDTTPWDFVGERTKLYLKRG